ncbi:MAG: hypothetical protein KDA91_03640 [Planctomycetaceae bacterium]|nr:hypothetical protein [Planctomycetaceae bacterium]
MPNAIRTDSRNNRTTGFARPGIYSNQHGTPKQHVHDGDTIAVQLDGNVGVRMLGIDTPEVSFSLPPVNNFVSLEDNRWSDFLSDPFHDRFGPMTSELPARLRAWFQVRCSAPQARTHFEHAVAARDEFQAMIAEDMQIMQQTPDTFSYYMNFGFEIMDGYGRLLCIVNRNQPKANEPTPRPKTYNIRLLERGRAFPYFIWPNINPWDRPESIDKAVIPPGQAKVMADNDTELRMARGAVRNARQQHRGIFDPMNPLLLEPFELRNLSRRVAASRYLIDLNSDSDSLIHPLDYPLVPSTEDRLWIPSAYVPLFEKAGWRVPARPQS